MNGDEIIVQAPGNEPVYDVPQNAQVDAEEDPWQGRAQDEGPWQGRAEAEEVEYFELNDESNDFIIFE